MEEVHLWRGSAQQRAQRNRIRKSGQFTYFDKQLSHPDWAGKKVLDFGGNVGSLLLDPDCTILPENYYCLDVLREALEEGRNRFPQAHWIHYDRYNCSFNPEGKPHAAIPDMGIDFDMILAYSVFTHTTREDMNDLVARLRTRLVADGTLAFTFIDPHWKSWPDMYHGNNLQWRLERVHQANPAVNVSRLLEKSRGATWCALIDGSELFVEANGTCDVRKSNCMTYNVYYTAEFLQREFPCTIRLPINNEMQHCCIMRNKSS